MGWVVKKPALISAKMHSCSTLIYFAINIYPTKKFCTLGSFSEFYQPGMDAFIVIYRCLEKSFCSNLMNTKLKSVAHQRKKRSAFEGSRGHPSKVAK